jgi:hypothetical protein
MAGLQFGKSTRERLRDDEIDTKFAEEIYFLLRRHQQQSRVIGMKQAARVRVKGEHGGDPVILLRGANGRLNDRLMSEVDAVKHANGEMQRAAGGPHIVERSGAEFRTHDLAGEPDKKIKDYKTWLGTAW